MSEQRSSVSASDSFALLSDETRVGIVRALGDNRRRDPADREFVPLGEERPARLSYSELKDHAGIRDNGRLNYHLNELLGEFVREVPGGYQLTWLGFLAYRYLVAGTFEWTERRDVELDDETCADCGSAFVAEYGPYQFLSVGCPACEDYYVGVHFPARGLATRSDAEAVAAADRKMRWQFALMRGGVCPWCGGVVDRSLQPVADRDTRVAGSSVVVTYSCLTCGNVRYPSVGIHLLAHPEVLEFYAARGRNLWEIRTWDVDFLGDEHLTVESTDPLRVAVTVALDGDRLRLTVEEDTRVSAVDRASG